MVWNRRSSYSVAHRCLEQCVLFGLTTDMVEGEQQVVVVSEVSRNFHFHLLIELRRPGKRTCECWCVRNWVIIKAPLLHSFIFSNRILVMVDHWCVCLFVELCTTGFSKYDLFQEEKCNIKTPNAGTSTFIHITSGTIYKDNTFLKTKYQMLSRVILLTVTVHHVSQTSQHRLGRTYNQSSLSSFIFYRALSSSTAYPATFWFLFTFIWVYQNFAPGTMSGPGTSQAFLFIQVHITLFW